MLMPLTALVTIVLRLFAIYYTITGLISVTSAIARSVNRWAGSTQDGGLFLACVPLLVAVGLFLWSRPIAKWVTPRDAEPLQFGPVTRRDMARFGFTILGLYFVVASLPALVNWMHHYIVTAQTTDASDPTRMEAFYGFTEMLVMFLAGAVTLLFAPHFSRKLTAFHDRMEADAPTPDTSAAPPSSP